MNIEMIREYCLKLPFTKESFPFDEETLVFKVSGKIFALLNLISPQILNVKCDPESAVELREKYEFIRPGYHMNKKHWNTIDLENNIREEFLYEWINDSYELVVSGMSKKEQIKIRGKV